MEVVKPVRLPHFRNVRNVDGDWWRAGKRWPVGIGIGGERGKVGHVGFGRGVTSFFGGINMSLSKKPEAEVKFQNVLFIHEKLPGPKVTSGNVGPDRVSRRASHFILEKTESPNKTNKTKCHRRPAWTSCRSGRTMSHRSGSTANKPQFSQRV